MVWLLEVLSQVFVSMWTGDFGKEDIFLPLQWVGEDRTPTTALFECGCFQLQGNYTYFQFTFINIKKNCSKSDMIQKYWSGQEILLFKNAII